MGSNKNIWDIQKMQNYCDEFAIGYIVLDTKIVDKGYQKQLWALLKCPIPEHEPVWMWWNHFTHDRRCKHCKPERLRKTLSKNLNEVEKIFNEYGYTIDNLDDFKNVDTCIACTDKEGFKYYTNISSLKAHNGSASKYKKANPYAMYNIKLFCSLFRPEYEFISEEYKGIKEEYKWRYNGKFDDENNHNREFVCTADAFIHGMAKHPDVLMSSLEQECQRLLNLYDLSHETQKTFEGCKYKNLLRFDFYIPKYNICIEMDGLQHDVPIDYFGGIKYLKETKKRDGIKNDYCKEHGINLIRIKQIELTNITEIEDILKRELTKLHVHIRVG